MFHRLRNSSWEQEGFTLIELLVVIIIIGILAAIAIPVFLNQRKKGWDAQAKSDAHNLGTLEETYFADNSTYVSLASTSTASDVTALLTDYRPSSSVSGWYIVNYSVAPTKVPAGTSGTGGVCIQVTSKSGATFVYDSVLGGQQAGNSAVC